MNAPRRPPASFARPLAEYALRQIDPLVARRGFGEAALILRWPEIVGEQIASLCAPERLQWPPRPRRRVEVPSGDKTRVDRTRHPEPATLILRVEPGFGLDIQHMTQTIVDRVNAHLGWRCVCRIVQRQGASSLSTNHPGLLARPSQRPPDPAARARAQAVVAGIADLSLQSALLRLGENALRPKTGADREPGPG